MGKPIEYTESNLRFPWQVVTVLSIYRLVLFVILLSIYLAFYIIDKQYLYPWWVIALVGATYCLISMIFLYLSFTKRYSYQMLTVISVMIDILFLTFMISFNPSLIISYGILMNIVIAAGSVIVIGRLSLLLAAWASICVLATELIRSWNIDFTLDDLQKTGFLCSTFFVIAIITYALSRRIRASEKIARQREQDVNVLQNINALIVQNMEQGVLVVDEADRIINSNQAAWYLLASAPRQGKPMLADISQDLMACLSTWRKDSNMLVSQAIIENLGVMPKFRALAGSKGDRKATIIILEDAAAASQKAQQIKLASLGRLTASIAHEIRNPLSAISQASQILDENIKQEKEDKLLEIIKSNCVRVNEIIESILQLSRRKESTPNKINLLSWINDFINNLKQQYSEQLNIELITKTNNAFIFFDQNQLHQILQNLCENGLYYSKENIGKSAISIVIDKDIKIDKIFIDIIDFGKGIDEDKVNYIFEPFYTSKKQGTGLGLYIARELCQTNNAKLQYIKTNNNESCFRIYFNTSTVG